MRMRIREPREEITKSLTNVMNAHDHLKKKKEERESTSNTSNTANVAKINFEGDTIVLLVSTSCPGDA